MMAPLQTNMAGFLCCILLIVITIQDSEAACPEKYAPFEGRCLQVLPDPYNTYELAKNACIEAAGLPASLPTPEVYYFAVTLAYLHGQYVWFGLESNSTDFFWLDGSPYSWSFWGYRNPDLSKPVAIDNNAVSWISNTAPRKVICQADIGDPDPCGTKWTYTRNALLPDETSASPVGGLEECLQKCQVGCEAAAFFANTKECKMYDKKSSDTTPIQGLGNSHLYQKLCKECTSFIVPEHVATMGIVHPDFGASEGLLYKAFKSGVSTGFWRPSTASLSNLYLNYSDLIEIRAVSVQGSGLWGFYPAANPDYKISNYFVAYSLDGQYWRYISKTERTDNSFHGNWDYEMPHTLQLQTPVLARHLRVYPKSSQPFIGMRFGVFGCVSNQTASQDEELQWALGMEDGFIQDYQMASNSYINTATEFSPPWAARLGHHTTIDKMTPFWSASLTLKPYLDVNLLMLHFIEAIAIEGNDELRFIDSYELHISTDCITYNNSGISRGNMRNPRRMMRSVKMFTKCVRIQPKTQFATNALTLRLEIYGKPRVINWLPISQLNITHADSTCSCGGGVYVAVCGDGSNSTLEVGLTVDDYNIMHLMTQVHLLTPSAGMQLLVFAKTTEDWVLIGRKEFNGTARDGIDFKRAYKAKTLKFVASKSPAAAFCSPVVIRAESAPRCPPYFVSHKNSCYGVMNGDVKQIKQQCQQYTWTERGKNFKDDDATTKYFLTTIINDQTRKFWVDATYNNTTSQWQWSDGSKLTTTFWDNNFPTSDATKNCSVSTGVGAWSNVECDSYASLICEIPQNRNPKKGRCEWFLFPAVMASSVAPIETHPSSTRWECILKCSALTNCRSVNFNILSKECKLYGDADAQDLTFSTQGIHFWNFCSDCERSLVWGPKGVGATKVTASNYADAKSMPKYAWLGNTPNATQTGSWRGTATWDYIQVDLGKVYKINRFATQGCGDFANEYVSKMYVFMSNNSIHWIGVREALSYKQYRQSHHSTIFHHFAHGYARFFRLDIGGSYGNKHCLRFDVFGCELPNQPDITGCSVYLKTAYERAMRLNGVEIGHRTNTDDISVARVHRINCTHEFDKFTLSLPDHVDRLKAFIANTTSDSVLVGASDGSVTVPSELKPSFQQLGIPDVTKISGHFTFVARPGHPNDTDYHMAAANHDFLEQVAIIAPFTRSFGRDLNYSRLGMEYGGEMTISQFILHEYLRLPFTEAPFQIRLFGRPIGTLKFYLQLIAHDARISIDFGIPHNITGMLAHGGRLFYARTYSVSGSMSLGGAASNKFYWVSLDPKSAKGMHFSEPVTGRYIKVYPSNQFGYKRVRMEFMGYPLDLPVLLLNTAYAKATASGSGTCAALDAVVNLTSAACPDFCLSPDGGGAIWWKADLATQYYITHIHLIGGGLQNLTYGVKLYSSMTDRDALKDMEYKMALSWQPQLPGFLLKFSPVLRSKWLKLDFTNATCFKIVFHGQRAPFCPPSSTLDPERRLCYTSFTRQVATTYETAEAACKQFNWISEGHLPLPKTQMDVEEIRGQDHQSNLVIWLGLRKVNGNWTWADGRVVTNTSEIPASGINWETSTSHCAYTTSNTYQLALQSCTQRYGLVCHTPTEFYEQDLAKQQTAMAKRITYRDCDIWQWATIGRFYSPTYKGIAYVTMTSCEEACHADPKCGSAYWIINSAHYTLYCRWVVHPFGTGYTGPNTLYLLKYHFCYDNDLGGLLEGWPDNNSNVTVTVSGNDILKRGPRQIHFNNKPNQIDAGDGFTRLVKDSGGQTWVQVALSRSHMVKGLLLRGGVSFMVRTFYLMYQPSIAKGNIWVPIMQSDNQTIALHPTTFNTRLHSRVMFSQAVWTRVFRVYPYTWSGYADIRLEVLGQKTAIWNDTERKVVPVGMESRAIANFQIRCSSEGGSGAVAACECGRKNFKRHLQYYASWEPSPYYSRTDWLEVDLLVVHEIVGFQVKGNEPSAHFIRDWQFTYSNNGSTFVYYNTTDNTAKMTFKRNTAVAKIDHCIYFNTPITARIIRIHPTNYQHRVAVNLEYYGRINDKSELTSSDVAVAIPSSTLDSSACQPPGGNSVMRSADCTMWCPQATAGQNTTVTFRFILYYYITTIILIHEEPNKTKDPVIHIKKSETDYINLRPIFEHMVKDTTNGTVTEYFYLDHPVLAENMTISLTALSTSFCTTVRIFGRAAESCPLNYMPAMGRCYRYHSMRLSQNNSNNRCIQDNDNWPHPFILAAPLHATEVENILKILFWVTSHVWLGITKINNTNEWGITDKKTMNYTLWASNQPNVNYESLIWYRNSMYSHPPNNLYGQVCQTTAINKKFDAIDWHYIPRATEYNKEGTMEFKVLWWTECIYACATNKLPYCKTAYFNRYYRKCILSPRDRFSFSYTYKYSYYEDMYEKYIPEDACNVALLESILLKKVFVSSGNGTNASPQDVIHGRKSTVGSLGFWRPSWVDAKPYVTVIFATPVKIHRLLTRGSGVPYWNYYFREMHLEISKSLKDWEVVQLTNNLKYPGMQVSYMPYVHVFKPVQVVIAVKFYPRKFSYVGGQIQFYGCRLKESNTCFESASPFGLSCSNQSTIILRTNSKHPASFKKNYESMTTGFEEDNGATYWLGGTNTYKLTLGKQLAARIEMWDDNNTFFTAEFDFISFGEVSQNFLMKLGLFMKGSAGHGSMAKYSAPLGTSDNDITNMTCMGKYKSSWWYRHATFKSQGSCVTSILVPNDEIGLRWRTLPRNKITKILMKTRYAYASHANLALQKTAVHHPSILEKGKAKLSVDGDITADFTRGSCSQTGTGNAGKLWWRVDLEKTFQIQKIQIYGASCCMGDIADLDIFTGTTSADGDFSSNGYTSCGTTVGATPSDDQYEITCSSVTDARYIGMQRKGAGTLTICDVAVRAKDQDPIPLDKPCEWNSDCFGTLTECRPAPSGNGTTCQCLLYHLRVSQNVCIPETDLSLELSEIEIGDTYLIRNTSTNAQIGITINNNKGAPVDIKKTMTNATGPNFRLRLWFADSDTLTSTYNDTVWTSDYNLTLPAERIYTININETFGFSADICFHLKFICIQLESTSPLVYKDVNISNNFVCTKPNFTISCQPDIDVALTAIKNETGGPIIRGTVNNNILNVTLLHFNGSVHVARLLWKANQNFNMTYAYHTENVTTYAQFQTLKVLQGSFKDADSKTNLSLGGNVTLQAVVPNGMTVAECKNVIFLCMVITGAPHTNLSSFTDNELDNNLRCYNVSASKICSPKMKVTASTFSISEPTFKFVRGYYDIMKFEIALRNDDPAYDVVQTAAPDVNYNFSVATADNTLGSARKKRSTPVIHYFPTVVNVNLLSSNLSRNATTTINGTVSIKINRTDCLAISNICVLVLPGNGSSYSLATGNSHIKCIAANPYKLCDGVGVENLTVIPPTVFAEQNKPQNFSLSWDKGSDVVIKVTYGDGQTLQWAWDQQNHTLSYKKKNVTLSHNYTILANNTLTVTATNQVGTVTTTAKIVVEPNLQQYIKYFSQYTPGPTPLDVKFTFSLLPTVTSPIPVIFWCNFTYDDPQNSIKNASIYGEINGGTFQTPHTYKTDRPYSVPECNCYNHISSVPFKDNITLRQNITELKITSPRLAWKTIDEAAIFMVTMKTGSHAKLNVTYGDGQTNTTTHPKRVSGNTTVTFSHIYSLPNNYSVIVKAYNEYYQDETTYSVILQNKVQGISINNIPPVAVPPGTFSLTLVPNSALPTPTNMWFNVTVSGASISQGVYSHPLSTGTAHAQTITMSRSNCGENQTIVVDGYNLASAMNFTANVSVYEMITGLKLTPIPKTSLPNETWALNVSVATGSSVVYTVDFGDGDKRTVKHSSPFASESMITLLKNYSYVNTFTVTVTATNPVSSKTASFVHEWACYPPNITLPDEVNDEAKPKKVFKSLPYTIEPQHHLVCIDTQKVLYHWTVLDYNTKALQTFSTTDKIFNLTARTLQYGKYIVRLNASMYQEVNTTGIADAYLEIVKTPLVAKIVGGIEAGTVFGRAATVDGMEESLDLDEMPGNQKQGLSYGWECKRNYSDPLLKELTAKNETLKKLAETSQGCFKQPAGKLSITSGKFVGQTTKMLPFTSYTLVLKVSKDTRIGNFTQNFLVAATDPPLLSLRCRENCGKKKGVPGEVPILKWAHDKVLRADCLKLCRTDFGNAVFYWTLKQLDDVNRKILTPEEKTLKNITNGGIESQAVIIKGQTLTPGATYSLEVMSWTLGSWKNTTSYKMAINVPPYGGSCTVLPLDGFSSYTPFVMECAKWREFQKTIAASVLAYDFRIRLPGSTRSFPVFFGIKTISDPSLFPVGDIDLNFRLEVVILIVDSLGDFAEFVLPVRVIPRPIPVEDILNGLDNVAANVAKLIASGSFQAAATNAFAAISEINVPLDYFNITAGSSQYDELQKRKIALRTQLAKLVAQLPITEPQYLEQSNELMRTLLKVPGEIQIEALDLCSTHLAKMKDKFFEFKRSGVVENPRRMGADIIDTSIKVMIAGNLIHGTSSSGNSTDDTASGTVTAVKRVMRNTVIVMDEVTQFLSDWKDPNDPNDVMNYKELDLVISKVSSDKLKDLKVDYNWGGVTIQKTADLFGSKQFDCIENKLVFSQFNPFIYGTNNTPNVETSVLRFLVKECPSKRAKRSLSNTTTYSNIPGNVTMTMASKSLPEMTFMNITPNGTLGVIYHTFDVPAIPKSLEITLKPNAENETFDLHIRKLKMSNLENHDWKVTLPRNASTENETFTFFIPASNVTAGLIYIGVRKTPEEGSSGAPSGGEWSNMEYYFRILELGCRVWNEVTEQWDDCNFEMESAPSSTKMRFKSNLLGSLGAGLNVKPNTINFSTVFDNIGQKLVDNIAVVIVVIGILLIYIPATVFLRRLDVADLIKWQCIPLLDNYDGDKYQYEVHVFTGNARAATTSSEVSIILTGTDADSGVRRLKVKDDQIFKKGEASYFTLKTPDDLGYLYSIKVWHDNTGEGIQQGWQLAQIAVVDIQREIWYLFPSDQWFDENRGDRKTARLLVLSSAEEEDKGKLMRTNMRRKFYNDHLWISLTNRAWRVKFTRVQRLACILAIFYLSMITNAMFYRDPGNTQGSSAGTISLGTLTISVNDLITGFLSSMIVMIPVTGMVLGFVYSAMKPKTDDRITDKPEVYNDSQNGLPGVHRIKEKKRAFSLPYWFRYVAWVLVFLSVALSAFFTVLYSFEWGRTRSTAWLVAFLFSKFSNVFFIEPLKILIITMVISFYFGESSFVKEYERDYGRRCDFHEVNHYFTPEHDLHEVLEVMAAQSSEDLNKKRKLDNAVSTMFQDCAKQIIFMIILLLVMYSNQDSQLYRQNQSLRNVFMNHQPPKAPRELYNIISTRLIPGFYMDKVNNGKNTSNYQRKFITQQEGYRLGSPKLIQLRVLQGHCSIHNIMENAVSRCGAGYSQKSPPEDRKNYLLAWKPLTNNSYQSVVDSHPVGSAFTYHNGAKLNRQPFWGALTTYGGGGYPVNLGYNSTRAHTVLNLLQKHNWLDRQTRAVFIEANLINMDSNLFSTIRLLYEFPEYGGCYTKHRMETLELYRYTGGTGLLALLFEILSLIMFVVLLVLCIKDIFVAIRKNRPAVNFWTVIRIMLLVFFAVSMICYVLRTVSTTKALEEVINNKDSTAGFDNVIVYSYYFLAFFGFAIFMAHIELLYILRYNVTICLFTLTLRRAGTELLSMAAVGGIVFMAFASGMTLFFGTHLRQYAWLAQTAVTLAQASLNRYDYYSVRLIFGHTGAAFLILYLLFISIVAINFFITLINYVLEETSDDDEATKEESEVIDHLMKMVKSFIVSDSEGKSEDKEDPSELQDEDLTSLNSGSAASVGDNNKKSDNP